MVLKTEAEVRQETKREPILSAVLDNICNGWTKSSKNDEFRPFRVRKDDLTTEGGCILWGSRVVIPQTLREKVLIELHEVHPGVNRMKALARSFMWWPGMGKDIQERVKNCILGCSNQSNPSAAPVHAWEYPTGPWERLHIDFAGPFMGKMFLIVVDAFSKWIEVEMMSNITSVSTVAKLRKIFAMHGLPQVIVSDNGPAFVGKEFKDFLTRNVVKHVLTAPYHPASNGQVEQMVRIFKEPMKTLQFGDVETKLNRLLFNYRITPHTATGSSPAEFLFKRQLRSAFHRLRPEQQIRMKNHHLVSKEEKSESKNKLRTFEKGSVVWVRNFAAGKNWLPGTVIGILGAVNYEVELCGIENFLPRHVDQLVIRSSELAIDGMDILPQEQASPMTENELVSIEVEGDEEISGFGELFFESCVKSHLVKTSLLC